MDQEMMDEMQSLPTEGFPLVRETDTERDTPGLVGAGTDGCLGSSEMAKKRGSWPL